MAQTTCKRCNGIGLLYRDPRGLDYLGDYVAVECDDCAGTGNTHKLFPYGCEFGPDGKHFWLEVKKLVVCGHCDKEGTKKFKAVA